MNHLILIPAALVAFHGQAAAPVKMPVTQANHASWMRTYVDTTAGGQAIAYLTKDVIQDGKTVAPKGSKLLGKAAQDGASVTYDRFIHPDGSYVAIEPFSLQGLPKEGE